MIFVWIRHYPREELLEAHFSVCNNVESKDIQKLPWKTSKTYQLSRKTAFITHTTGRMNQAQLSL